MSIAEVNREERRYLFNNGSSKFKLKEDKTFYALN